MSFRSSLHSQTSLQSHLFISLLNQLFISFIINGREKEENKRNPPLVFFHNSKAEGKGRKAKAIQELLKRRWPAAEERQLITHNFINSFKFNQLTPFSLKCFLLHSFISCLIDLLTFALFGGAHGAAAPITAAGSTLSQLNQTFHS